jgi:branched-chain amino acid transport system substrate-binding protein
MRFLLSTSFILAFVLISLIAPSSHGADKMPVIIGLFYNVTGSMAPIDGPGMNGARLAAKLVNERGGILEGRKVQIMAFDTRSDLQLASSSAESAAKGGMTAAAGYGDSDFVLAAAPHFQGKGVPFVTSGATNPTLPGRIGDKLFLTAFGDDDQASAVAEYAYERLKARRVVIWTDNTTDFTKTLARFFREYFPVLGGRIVDEHFFKSGDRDFLGLIAQLKNTRPTPDALFVASLPSDAGSIVKQVREAGLAIPILSGDSFDTKLVLETPGPGLANQVFFSTHVYPGDRRPRVQDFVNAYKNEYKTEPENAFAALGYDAVGLVIDAVRRADSTDTRLVAEALANTRGYEGITGTISYGRRPGIPSKPVSIMGINNGSFELMETWSPIYRSASSRP